ncbi:hypothetical protein [Kalamiella sp. sgz302252]|uniref:hypothetical protein n=1 Tax=Pantoea sp. sgz302252 TaxID=3341827 RepID=UPI0036D363B0
MNKIILIPLTFIVLLSTVPLANAATYTTGPVGDGECPDGQIYFPGVGCLCPADPACHP